MNQAEFWNLVNRAHESSNGDMDQKCSLIKANIESMSKEDATEIRHLFDLAMDQAYSWELWAAAYIANGGCGDDSFSDFRASLISRGEAEYNNALNDPDSLADVPFDEEKWFYEGYQYAITEGVESVLGSNPPRKSPHPESPSGSEWDEDDENQLKNICPKLWEASQIRFSPPIPPAEPDPKVKKPQSIKKPWWKFW